MSQCGKFILWARWLFNWYSLYAQAWKVKSNLTDDVTNVQYYALTFVEHKFVFWVSIRADAKADFEKRALSLQSKEVSF